MNELANDLAAALVPKAQRSIDESDCKSRAHFEELVRKGGVGLAVYQDKPIEFDEEGGEQIGLVQLPRIDD